MPIETNGRAVDCTNQSHAISYSPTIAHVLISKGATDPMMHKRLALAPLGALLTTLLFGGPALACTKNDALLAIADAEAALALTPCDPIGSLYLDGLNSDRFFSFGETQKLEDAHAFYGFARTYLNSLPAPDETADAGADTDANADPGFAGFEDAYASLIMSAFLLETSSDAGAQRPIVYSAYAKLAYAQYAALRGTAQSMLVSAIEDEMAGTGLTTFRELHCFVRHDMPGIAEARIIASNAFRGCVTTDQ